MNVCFRLTKDWVQYT